MQVFMILDSSRPGSVSHSVITRARAHTHTHAHTLYVHNTYIVYIHMYCWIIEIL